MLPADNNWLRPRYHIVDLLPAMTLLRTPGRALLPNTRYS